MTPRAQPFSGPSNTSPTHPILKRSCAMLCGQLTPTPTLKAARPLTERYPQPTAAIWRHSSKSRYDWPTPSRSLSDNATKTPSSWATTCQKVQLFCSPQMAQVSPKMADRLMRAFAASQAESPPRSAIFGNGLATIRVRSSPRDGLKKIQTRMSSRSILRLGRLCHLVLVLGAVTGESWPTWN